MLRLTCAALACLPIVRAAASCWRETNCTGPAQEAFPGPWSANIYAPSSRSVAPLHSLEWPSLKPIPLLKLPILQGNASVLVYDFGVEVGGIVSVEYHATGPGEFSLAFSESRNFIGKQSDNSNGDHSVRDGALTAAVKASGVGKYSMPDKFLRGGFRYLTLSVDTRAAHDFRLAVLNINLELSIQPAWPNLRAYAGYFHSSDPLLNRIWYAGAYTLQTNNVPPTTGRAYPFPRKSWLNNARLGEGNSILVDGAKRDRAVWPGDMGVAVPSSFVSLGDLESVRNALSIMYELQDRSTGAFDESGPPLSQKGSDTYHMWTLIGTYNYYLYAHDTAFLDNVWPGYVRGIKFILGKIDKQGMLNVTGVRDWARWQYGAHNTEANMILYRALTSGARLAEWKGQRALAEEWQAVATKLAATINERTFVAAKGSFKDNDTVTTLHPQDANALAILFGVAPASRIPGIAKQLEQNWTPIGPTAPELPHNVSPFITSLELAGRFAVRDTARALHLLRTTWGWILNNANSTQSTFLEGYLTNGSFAYRNSRGYEYDESYTSHAHGWSTGPTASLTNFILGLDVVEPGGASWSLRPQWGDLTTVEGGFSTRLGRFSAKWSRDAKQIRLSWDVPLGTNGNVGVPLPAGARIAGLPRGVKLTFEESAFEERVAVWSCRGGKGYGCD